MNIDKQIEVMTHFKNGGEVEVMYYEEDDQPSEWLSAKLPNWDWLECEYRIKPTKSKAEIERESVVKDMQKICKVGDFPTVFQALYDAGYRKVGEEVLARTLDEFVYEQTAIHFMPSLAGVMLKHFHICRKEQN